MPITQSAKKALRQNIKRRARNDRKKKISKKTVKEYRKLIIGKQFEEAKNLLPKVFKVLDKSAKAKTIKKNTANRLKSRLSKLIVNK